MSHPPPPTPSLGLTRPVLVVLASVVMYAILFMAQVPLLPYIVKQLGAESNAQYGMLQSLFSSIQFIGGLVSGPIVDRYGGKALLVVSLLASAMCYATTASATSMTMLYISRVPSVLQHAVLAARTLVTNASSEHDRARLLGYVGVAYGIGFAIGPALGGALSDWGLRTTAWVATLGSLLSAAMVVVLVPGPAPGDLQKSGGSEKEGTSGEQLGGKEGSRWFAMQQVLALPNVRSLLTVKALSGIAFALLQAVCTIMFQQQFNLSSKQNGLILSGMGVITIITQALLIDRARKQLGDAQATRLALLVMLGAFCWMAISTSLVGLLVALSVAILGGILVATLNTAQLTQAVPATATGTVLAIDMSLGSGLRILTPSIGTSILGWGGSRAIGGVSAACVAVLCLLLYLGLEPVAGKRGVNLGDEHSIQEEVKEGKKTQ